MMQGAGGKGLPRRCSSLPRETEETESEESIRHAEEEYAEAIRTEPNIGSFLRPRNTNYLPSITV